MSEAGRWMRKEKETNVNAQGILKILLTFLAFAFAFVVVVYVSHLLLGMLALPSPLHQIAVLTIGVGAVYFLVRQFGTFSG